MKKYLVLLSLGMFFYAEGKDVNSEAREVDLEEAVASAYNNNAGWKAEQAAKNAADAQYKQSKTVFLPTLDASLKASRVGNDVSGSKRDIYGRPVHERDVQKSTKTQMALQLNQNLFNSFKDYNNMKSKENAARAMYHRLKRAEQDLIIKVVKAYTAVWAERQKLQANIKKEENLRKLYEAQQVCLGAGMATPADVAEAESKYQTAVFDRVDAETKVIEAESEFKKVTGIAPSSKMHIVKLDIKLPKDLEQLISVSLVSNQEILQEKFNEKAALNDLYAARGALGPKCDVSVSVGRNLNKHEPRFSIENNTQNTYSAELSVTVPIFNAVNYVNTEVYQEKAKQAKFTLEDKVLEIKKNCHVYWRTYKSAEASIKSSSTAVKSAEIASERNLDQVNLGMKSNTEFLDAETSLFNARINLVTSIKNKIDAMIQLFALTGNLDLHSMLDTLKHNKGILDPIVSNSGRKYVKKAYKPGKNALRNRKRKAEINSSLAKRQKNK